ncbi:MAG: dTDP-4-dehydrorhamnose reductase [Bacteroidales bacterium]|nr:dTDP-4-dehydrorhamnose reductase [Bacteroidales bacterium]
MKILVTGKNGQLGTALQTISKNKNDFDYIFIDKEDVNLSNLEAVAEVIRKIQPDILVNCAGYTAVDQAEDEPELAELLNGEVVGLMAALSMELNFLFIHISTDYVFDGKAHQPYEEDNIFNAPSKYGKSKISGEENILIEAARAVIIRTSWLYSPWGKNFVKTMLKLSKQKNELGVVYDQIGTPTYAIDLANAIMTVIENSHKIKDISIYHYSNEGAISWYDFAKAIMEIAKIDCHIKPIQTHEFPTKAPRPFYSVLNKSRIKEDFNMKIPYWKDSLKKNLIALGEISE